MLADAAALKKNLPKDDQARVEEHLSSVRDVERAITSLPPEYRRIDPPEYDDMKDWPRIAKLQSDLLAYALITRQTRVASYMLTKCQGICRFPLARFYRGAASRLHPCRWQSAGRGWRDGQRIMRDICRWHVEEFAYLLGQLKSIPEGDGTLLDHCCLVYVHEHAEANPHKNNGLGCSSRGMRHASRPACTPETTGTVGDLYVTLADEVMHAGIGTFPTFNRKMTEVLA